MKLFSLFTAAGLVAIVSALDIEDLPAACVSILILPLRAFVFVPKPSSTEPPMSSNLSS